VTPKSHTMNEVVAIMTGAADPDAEASERMLAQAKQEHPKSGETS
jgi:hypothetical protein